MACIIESLESRRLLSVVSFSGLDVGAGPTSARPKSSAAAAKFDTAAAKLGTESIITFEGVPTGTFSTLTVAPGVTISGTGEPGTNQSISNANAYPPDVPLGGFNTTVGGKEYVNQDGGTLTFKFATPVQFFGAYFSGVQSFYADNIQFSDGTAQKVSIPVSTISTGGLAFAGFTDSKKSISSVTIYGGTPTGWDEFGIDDVRYQLVKQITLTAPAKQTAYKSVAASVKLGSFTQAGTTAPFKDTISWGDGSASTVLSLKAAGTIPATSHTFAKTGTFKVTEVITDAKGVKSNTVTFTETVTVPPPSSISGIVFDDVNGNGIKDPHEAGLGLFTVYLDLKNDGKLDKGDPSVTTNIYGDFTFKNLAAGTYTLRVVPETGFKTTKPAGGFVKVTLTIGEKLTNEFIGEQAS